MNVLWFLPIISLMMFVHELGHYVTARLAGITVQEFGFGLPPRLWGYKAKNGVIYSINWIPFGAFVKMLGEEDPSAPNSFASKPRLVRAIVLVAGSAMNFLLAVVAFAMAGIVGLPGVAPDSPVTIAQIAPASPAEAAGLQPGDVIVSAEGQPVASRSFREVTQAHLDQPMQIQYRRGDQTYTITLTPRSNPPEGQGAIGIAQSVGLIHVSPLAALGQGFNQTLRVIWLTLSVPKMLLDGSIAPSDAQLVGLVGMAQETSATVSYVADTGFWYPIFLLTGLLSSGLSIANMLPIPALDGGRLFFVILEWIRRRRIPPEREAAYHFVGIVVLLTIMVIISFNNLTSPLPPIDWSAVGR
jgi:regulator of sigma E protease